MPRVLKADLLQLKIVILLNTTLKGHFLVTPYAWIQKYWQENECYQYESELERKIDGVNQPGGRQKGKIWPIACNEPLWTISPEDFLRNQDSTESREGERACLMTFSAFFDPAIPEQRYPWTLRFNEPINALYCYDAGADDDWWW